MIFEPVPRKVGIPAVVVWELERRWVRVPSRHLRGQSNYIYMCFSRTKNEGRESGKTTIIIMSSICEDESEPFL